jgi:ATP-dependent Clp protease ATP-binding subunit ClpB
LRQRFRPEFLNRVDDVILFHRLDQAQLERIVGLQLRQLEERLDARRLHLVVGPAAKSWLAEQGYDPVYGARPLRRVLQRQLGDRIATAVLRGEFSEGDTLVVDVSSGGELILRAEHSGGGRGNSDGSGVRVGEKARAAIATPGDSQEG